ncbi:hypothetical protein (nucleomorph) [Guillardia theta]|uniref:Uncharacterized protein n=1 Tax=Guillardia theta TaxID=55529 RepID=Q98RZ5_GUITH|nr:hypothetical protein GTHECHR1013 [Guillardia theta]AAK39805.1 hypothetical protein [Guillardia theta]
MIMWSNRCIKRLSFDNLLTKFEFFYSNVNFKIEKTILIFFNTTTLYNKEFFIKNNFIKFSSTIITNNFLNKMAKKSYLNIKMTDVNYKKFLHGDSEYILELKEQDEKLYKKLNKNVIENDYQLLEKIEFMLMYKNILLRYTHFTINFTSKFVNFKKIIYFFLNTNKIKKLSNGKTIKPAYFCFLVSLGFYQTWKNLFKINLLTYSYVYFRFNNLTFCYNFNSEIQKNIKVLILKSKWPLNSYLILLKNKKKIFKNQYYCSTSFNSGSNNIIYSNISSKVKQKNFFNQSITVFNDEFFQNIRLNYNYIEYKNLELLFLKLQYDFSSYRMSKISKYNLFNSCVFNNSYYNYSIQLFFTFLHEYKEFLVGKKKINLLILKSLNQSIISCHKKFNHLRYLKSNIICHFSKKLNVGSLGSYKNL